jgi:iron complex outermembrane recepter protein
LSNEVGAKVDLFNSRVVGSLVYYSSALTNQLLTVVASDGSNIQQPIGKVNSRGWEFDLATKVSSRFTLLTSWSELRARTLAGLPLRGNPQRTIAVLGKYSFQHPVLRGLAIAAGGRYAAERAGDNNATFYTPDLEVYNLNLIYTRREWRAQVNIDNLMDSRQVTGSVDVSRLDLYNKRNVTFKLGRTF